MSSSWHTDQIQHLALRLCCRSPGTKVPDEFGDGFGGIRTLLLDNGNNCAADYRSVGKFSDFLKLFCVRNAESYGDWQGTETPNASDEFGGVDCNLLLFSGNA